MTDLDMFYDVIRHKRCVNCGCKMIHHDVLPVETRTGMWSYDGPCKNKEFVKIVNARPMWIGDSHDE